MHSVDKKVAARKLQGKRRCLQLYVLEPGVPEMKIIAVYIPKMPGRVAQSVGHLTRRSGVLGSIPGLATYFRFSFLVFKKGSCQLLAKVCARSTGKPLRRSKPAQEKCG